MTETFTPMSQSPQPRQGRCNRDLDRRNFEPCRRSSDGFARAGRVVGKIVDASRRLLTVCRAKRLRRAECFWNR